MTELIFWLEFVVGGKKKDCLRNLETSVISFFFFIITFSTVF